MFCTECGKKLTTGWEHCPRCGVEIVGFKEAKKPSERIAERQLDTPEEEKKEGWLRKTKEVWWPKITDPEVAKKAAHQGFGAALFVSGVTTVVVLLELGGVQLFGLGPSALVDAAAFLIIAWGIKKMSRVAAVAGAILFPLGQIGLIASGISGFSIVAVFITLAFINSVRGTFAYHRFKAE